MVKINQPANGGSLSESAGRDISQRIMVRELALLQSRFLELIQQQPVGQFLVLTGPAAFRGVYEKQPWGPHMHFEAPAVVSAHFAELTHGLKGKLEQKHKQFIFKGKSISSQEIHVTISISVPRELPIPCEMGLFYGRRDKPVPVRVAPLQGLLTSLLDRLYRNPNPSDMLDLWLFCASNSKAQSTVLSAIASRPEHSNDIKALSVVQLRHLKSQWHLENVGLPCTLPPFLQVYKDLKVIFTPPHDSNESGGEK